MPSNHRTQRIERVQLFQSSPVCQCGSAAVPPASGPLRARRPAVCRSHILTSSLASVIIFVCVWEYAALAMRTRSRSRSRSLERRKAPGDRKRSRSPRDRRRSTSNERRRRRRSRSRETCKGGETRGGSRSLSRRRSRSPQELGRSVNLESVPLDKRREGKTYALPPSIHKKKTCKNWMQGRCNHGTECFFAHDNKSGNDYNSNKDQEEERKSQTGAAEGGKVIQVVPTPMMQRRPCYEYGRGECRRGSTCNFYHQPREGGPDLSVAVVAKRSLLRYSLISGAILS